MNDSPEATLASEIPATVTDETIRVAIMNQLEIVGPDKTVGPADIARGLMGNDEKRWRLAMKSIRRVAVALSHAGEATIRRKGKIADPEIFRGVYRIGHPMVTDVHKPVRADKQDEYNEN